MLKTGGGNASAAGNEECKRLVKISRLSRRRFLLASILAAPFVTMADARLIEPCWVKTRRLRLSPAKPTHRLVHFTDVHHKGDRKYLSAVVKQINALSPDFVCFTGDLIEEKQHLAEALAILAGIKSPMYGVPGNHDYWSKVVFDDIEKTFAATGGGWLLDKQVVTHDNQISIVGLACRSFKREFPNWTPGTRTILLMHYPAWIQNLAGRKVDLILAGHSHGGQVRIPFYGPLIVPFGVDQYDLGLYRTVSGPLYVNPGIGWFPVPIRFNCRPEITVFDI